MAVFKSKSARYFSASLISLLVILLAAFFVIVRVYLPSEIRKLIYEFSEDNDIALTVDKITYNPFVGFRGEELKLTDLPERGGSSLEVSELTVRPELIRSYLSGKLIIEKLTISGAGLKLDRKILEYSGMKGPEEKEEEDKKKQEPAFEVRSIEIKDISISYGQQEEILNLEQLELSADEQSKDVQIIEFKGTIKQKNNFAGNLELNNSDKTGILDLKIPDIKDGKYLNMIHVPHYLSASLNTRFSYSHDISAEGGISVSHTDKGDHSQIADLDFQVKYGKDQDKLHIGVLNIASDIVLLSAKGDIKNVAAEPGLSVKGKVTVENISESKKWIIPLIETDLSGSLYLKDILLEGSPAEKKLSLTGLMSSPSMAIDEVKIKNFEAVPVLRLADGEMDLTLNDIHSEMLDGTFKGTMRYTSRDNNYSIRAELSANRADLEQIGDIFDIPIYGEAEDLKIGLDAGSSDITTDIMLRANNFSYGEDGDLLQTAKTVFHSPVRLTIKDYLNENREISISANDTGITGFTSYGIKSRSASVSNLAFNYSKKSGWEISLKASGPELEYPGTVVILSDFNLDMKLKENGSFSATGNLNSKKGAYEGFDFNQPETSFGYNDQKLELSDTHLTLPGYGSLRIGNSKIDFSEPEERNYTIDISDGNFLEHNSGISAGGIESSLVYKSGSPPGISGSISSRTIKSHGIELKNPEANIHYSDSKIQLSGFRTGFFGGTIRGRGSLDASGAADNFGLEIEVRDLTKIMGIDFIDLEKLRVEASGRLGEHNTTEGSGSMSFSGLRTEKNNRVSVVSGRSDIKLENETIFFDNGFIRGKDTEPIRVSGRINNLFSKGRGSSFRIPEIQLSSLGKILSPFLPDDIANGSFSGGLSFYIDTYNLFEKLSNWKGIFQVKNAGFEGSLSQTDFRIKGMNGTITLKDKTEFRNTLEQIMGKELVLTKDIHKRYADQFRDYEVRNNRDYLNIKQISYGFLTINNIKSVFEIDKKMINLLHLKSELYDGHMYGTGVLRFGGERDSYNLSLLVDDISLAEITDSLPSMQNYITGVVYGLLWFSVGNSYWTINGPFSFWAKDSENEKRTIGRALLEKLGAKSRFFTRSSRRYDKGVISGYIKDGVMTFKNFEISNRILGYQDLLIQADPEKNSISVKHLLSVIRELARRASEGGIEIDYEKKSN